MTQARPISRTPTAGECQPHRRRSPRAPFLLACGFWLVASLPAFAQQQLLTRDAKRECATCHLDWVDSFDRPGAVPLIDKPVKAQAAEEPMCLGCHDGSVGDSRRGVWLEHGHRMNEKPSDKIKVPEKMPLDEQGRMICRTCHTAHTVPGVNDISRIVFLRSAREGGLCQQCHVDRPYGAEHGSHPLAELPFELPKPIFDAHGRTDIANRSKMACQTCHTAHGATADNLLVMGTESGQLCKTCHEQLRPTEWHPDTPREHPQNPPLKNEKQKQAIKDMGTRIGPGDTLTCFSCHKMHDGKAGKFMLADTLQDSALCIRCHDDRKMVLESKHDLRKSKPDELNKMGLKAQESGPCGSCHSFHSYARETKPGAGDPVGVCISCHQPKDKSGAQVAGAPGKPVGFAHPPAIQAARLPESAAGMELLNHPDPEKKSLACYTCHDPHETNKKQFLKKDRDDLCSTCHTDRFATMGGKHDFTDKPLLKNAKGETAKDAGKCGFCHAVHGDTDLVMWVATKDKPQGPDDLCAQCHRTDGLAHDKPAFAFNHPTGPGASPTTRPAGGFVPQGAAASKTGGLPLFNEHALIDPNGFVSCASCHDPHANSNQQKEMLRAGGPVSNLCTTCHADYKNMARGPHDPGGKQDWPVKVEKQNDLCMTCHTPHSNDPERQRYAFVPSKAVTARADAACVTCHKDSAWAAHAKPADDAEEPEKIPLGRAMHPTTMPSGGHAGTAASGLPLVATTPAGAANSIGCKTCHNPHADPNHTPHLTRAGVGEPEQALCAKCHAEASAVLTSMHATDALAPHAASYLEKGLKSPLDPKSPACSPCHSTHAVEGSQKPFLWAGKVSGKSPSDADNRCLSCHDAPTDQSRVLLVQHPEEPLRTRKWAATRPIKHVPPDDDPSQIRCGSCHVSHGDGLQAHGAAPDLNTRRAARPMIRPGVTQQCATCHGLDAPRFMLYWHDPAKRRAVGRLIRKQD